MVIGYARLSKDDLRKKYVSIENQKDIINKYAQSQGLVVDKIYEDDGYTGYTLDRPAFNEIQHLVDDNLVDVLLVKDLSRLGRHNAGVLLVLERFRKHGVRVIMIDDNYDSATDDDDIVGIKTWYNERYVKDGSKKVRNALKNMQENGNLIMSVPYGYIKDPYVKTKYYIDEEAAMWVKKIFEMYANGQGYKNIAKTLNSMGVPTPSMLLDRRKREHGIPSKIKVATGWETNAIRRIIQNDFYIGTLRLRKTIRNGINGEQVHTSEDEQHVFENQHEPLISLELFNLVQSINSRRQDSVYKGIRKFDNIYAGLLFCGDCGSSLTVSHYNQSEITSYACRVYRERGVSACSAHSINKKELDLMIKDYLTVCKSAMKCMIESLDSILYAELRQNGGKDVRLKTLKDKIKHAQEELKIIMQQKIRDIAANPSMSDAISEAYDAMQNEKLNAIGHMQAQINEYESVNKNKSNIKNNFTTALELFDRAINAPQLSKRQLETLVEKIVIYDDQSIEIRLRGDLGNIFQDQSIMRMSKEDRIKRTIINYISDVHSFGQIKLINEVRKYDTIANYAIVPIINEFIEKGYVQQTAKRHRTDHPPYICIASKEEMLRGFNICTDIDTIYGYCNLNAPIETILKINIWIARYL